MRFQWKSLGFPIGMTPFRITWNEFQYFHWGGDLVEAFILPKWSVSIRITLITMGAIYQFH